MSKREAARQIREMGLTCRIDRGEFRVTFRPTDMPDLARREDVAYYTDDAKDAVLTAAMMRRKLKYGAVS